MFTSNAPIGFNEEAYTNAQTQTANGISQTHSALDGFAASFMAPEISLGDVLNKISPSLEYGLSLNLPIPSPQHLSGANMLEDELSNKASANAIGGNIGSAAGFLLQPMNWGITGAAEKGLSAAFELGGMGVARNVASKLPGALNTAVKGITASIPALALSNIATSTNPQTGSIDWGGVAKATGIGIGMGMAIGAGLTGIGIAGAKALGYMRAKPTAEPVETPSSEATSSANAQTPAAQVPTSIGDLTQSQIDDALADKAITPDEHQALSAYINKVDNQTVQSLGQRVAAKNGVQGDVNITFLKPSDLMHLPTIAGDGLAADIEPGLKSALQDYMLNNNIDEIRSDQVKMTALQAYSDHIAGRLTNQDSELSQLDKEADSARNQQVPENPAISKIQTQIKNMAESLNSVPETDQLMRQRISRQIDTLGKQLEVAKQPISLDTLDNLRNELTSDTVNQKEINPYKYKELVNAALTDHPYAKAILNRVNQGAKYNQQGAFKTISDNLLAMNKEGIAPQADFSKVQDYLKARNSSKVNLVKDQPTVAKSATAQVKPEDIKSQIDAHDEAGTQSESLEAARQSFNMGQKIRSGVSHLADLIHCVVGGV